jgi:hypothetical protein
MSYYYYYHEVKVTPRILLDYKIRITALGPGKIFFDFKRLSRMHQRYQSSDIQAVVLFLLDLVQPPRRDLCNHQEGTGKEGGR